MKHLFVPTILLCAACSTAPNTAPTPQGARPSACDPGCCDGDPDCCSLPACCAGERVAAR